MKNKTELILDFTNVVGEARAILQEHVQKRLFKLGYFWSVMPIDQQETQRLDAGGLYINSSEWNPRHITYSSQQYNKSGEYQNFKGETVMRLVFDAASQLRMFLVEASKARVEVSNICGVLVTITAQNIELDTTAFLTKVTEEAKKMQKELFGTKE